MPRRRPGLRATLATVALLGLTAAAAAAPPPPRAPAPPHARRPAVGGAPDTPADRRRDVEPAPAASRADANTQGQTLELSSRRLTSCALLGAESLQRKLLALQNASDVLSLEAWGDAHEYAAYDHVFFYFRAPFAMYVTLFWLGPDSHIVVPVDGVRIPGDRDVKVDTGGYIVPPLGREQWVAIGTLEPVAIDCRDAPHLERSLARMLALPHAIGRWEVWSKESAPVTPPL